MEEQERFILGVGEDAPKARRQLATLKRLRAIDAPHTRGPLENAAPRTLNARSADVVASFDYDAARDSVVAGSVRKTAAGQREQALVPDRLPLANGGRTVEVYLTGTPHGTRRADEDPVEQFSHTRGPGIHAALVVM